MTDPVDLQKTFSSSSKKDEKSARGRHLVEVVILALVPLVLIGCAATGVTQSAFITVAVAIAALGLFFVGFETSKPRLSQIMPTVVLAALAAASRVLFAPIPDVKPVSAICIVAGAVFGRRCGFMVGALAALVSNFFFGQGPWTPWQMYAWGLIGYLSGVLAESGLLERNYLVFIWGFSSALLFGFFLNAWHIVGFVHPLTPASILAAVVAAVPFDIAHGVATVVFLALLYVPWKKKLIRIKRKYELS